jgi:hemerythrin superfamily protein
MALAAVWLPHEELIMAGGKTADAIQLLMADHKEVDALFKQFGKLCESDGSGADKSALAEQICTMLVVHTTIEEEIFYPFARDALEEQDLLDEAVVEHASAKDLIEQIQSSSPDAELYDAKVQVLGEYVRHHVKEEESELFPKLKKAKAELTAVGEAMKARKEELMTQLESAGSR